jgi:hypothetical protein
MIIILEFILLSIISVLIFKYLDNFISDYKVWNGGISPYTKEPWKFIGKDFQNIKHYKDSLNNSISIKTCINILFKK